MPAFESSFTKIAGNKYNLSLNGRLDPGWAGTLSTGLATHRINIVRFAAIRESGWRWSSSVDINFAPGSPNPERLDFKSLLCPKPLPHHDREPAGVRIFR